MNRRGFLGAILAAGVAPAIVRAESLMCCSGIVLPSVKPLVYGGGLLSPEMIIRETMEILRDQMTLGRSFAKFELEEVCGAVPVVVMRRIDPFKALNSMCNEFSFKG